MDLDLDPDPGYFFEIYLIFVNKAEFSNFYSYFFIAKTWWTILEAGNF